MPLNNKETHVISDYIGTMRIANNREGIPHENWRKDYVGERGLIRIYQFTDYPEEYVIYLYLRNGKFFRSSIGNLQVNDSRIRFETKNSIYEFEIDPKSKAEEFYPMLAANAQMYGLKELEIGLAHRNGA